MGFKNTSAMAIIVAALLLGFFYIQPTFEAIGEIQDEIFVYKDSADKATEVNSQLNQLLGEIDSLRQSDVLALETYLPTAVGRLQVMYDVETLAQRSGLTIAEIFTLETEDVGGLQAEDIANLDIDPEEQAALLSLQQVEHVDTQVTVRGSYTNLKRFLDSLAANQYPLEVVSLEFSSESEVEQVVGPQSYTLVLRSYAFNYLRNR